jgi:hypothetical protein
MVSSVLNRKKRIEKLYVEEARSAYQAFPVGELIPHENPDFLLVAGSKIYGIEVTELCREQPRTEAATLSRVPSKAKVLYNSMLGNRPVDISLAFSRSATGLHPNQLASSLAECVYSRRESRGTCAVKDLPSGYCHIGIHEPRPEIDKTGHWHGVRAFDVEIATKQLIESRIASKRARLAKYAEEANVVWLLIVNDQFLGPQEVFVRPEDLAAWRFDSGFDRVLLYARDPGGGGKVFDLHST